MSDELDARSLALQCLLLGFRGPVAPAWILDALADGLGGLVLFGSNVGDGSDVASLTAALRTAAGRDIVLALDEEGGDVTRLDTVRGSASPGAAALGHLDDPDVTETVYRRIGERCAQAGVTVDLGPVADVNLDPRNPVIGLRAFSDDAGVAARHTAAAVRGIQSAGVAACIKHFPGHGATRDDSHHEVAVLDRTAEQIRAVELEPFRAGMAAGTRAVMTAHLSVPSLDPNDLATVSPAITTGLLRDELGFDGTVVTDALEMRAVSGTIGMVEGFVRALAAGADAIETGALDYPHLVQEIPDAVARAVGEGRLGLDRLADAARRTRAIATAPQAARAATGVEDAVFDRSIEIIGTLPDLRAPLVIECRTPGGMASGELPWSVASPLARLLPGTDVLGVTGAVPLPQGRDVVLVVRDPIRHDWQRPMLAAAAARGRIVVVDCGWPTTLPAALPAIRTRGIAPGLLSAAARALAAPVPAGGRR